MLPVPIMWEPFERVAIDIVEPLPFTDFPGLQTRYPDAVPLRSTYVAGATCRQERASGENCPFYSLSDQGEKKLCKLMT